MSKNVKRLISTLLAAGMLLSSFGVAFADTTDAAATAEVTAEVTAEAQSDSYYEEAIGLLTKMGIFEGYEDGSIKPDSTITRAEMATVILRVLATPATSAYSGMFTDVDAGHWAASTIQTAANAGIINGMGDGTFAPDSPVTYEQAVKMLVCAIGYDGLAKNLGGYPTGYISAAARKDIEISKNAPGAVGQNASRGTVAKLVYNTLNALYPVAAGSNAEGVITATYDDITVASKLHDVYKYEGLVLGTSTTTLDPSVDLTKGQVAIDDMIFNRSDVDMNDFVGYAVKAYYIEKNEDGDKSLIYAVLDKDNTTLVIQGTEIDSIEDVRSENGVIEYRYNNSSKTKKAKLDAPTIIYNGKKLYANDMEEGDDMDTFIRPSVGALKLNDNNGDGKYDVIFVEKYETVVATGSTDKSVTGKYNEPAKLTYFDNEDDDKIITIVKGGKEIATKNIKKWDVLTILRSVNRTGDQVIDVQVCNDTVEGKIKDVDEDDNGVMIVTIDGKEYKVDRTLENTGDIEVGTEGKFYLDVFGRIAGFDSASTVGKLSGSEQYGWLIRASVSKEADELKIKMFTQGGEVKTFSMADEVDYWGPNVKDKFVELDMSVEEDVETIVDDAATVKATGVEGYYQAGLVKYSTNSKDEIKSLIMPVVTTSYEDIDEDRVVIYNDNLDGWTGSGTMVGNKFAMQDNMIQFNVPETVEDINDVETYSMSTANATDYVYYDGIAASFAVAELDGNKPSVIIRYIGSSTNAADFTYNTADDRGWLMISDISEVYDEVAEETVYKITGYSNGNKAEYTTTKTTSVAAATGISGGYSGFGGDANRHYGTTPLWTAAQKQPTYTDADGNTQYVIADQYRDIEDLREFLAPGDIVGIASSGLSANIIIKMIDMSDYLDSAKTPWGSYKAYSTTRDGIAMGIIVDVDTSDNAVFTTSSGETYSYDPGYYMVTYNVDEEDVEDDVQVADLIAEDEDDNVHGDVVILRMFKGGQREIFGIRFDD